jgi:hypothetical protein
MNALHEETRARWGAHAPEQFIKTVMHDALRHKLDMASIVIHVYAQIVYQFPNSSALIVRPLPGDDQPPLSLRTLFINMRDCAARAQTAVKGDDDMTYVLPYSHESYISRLTAEIRQHVTRVESWARTIEADPKIESVTLPGAKGKSFGDVASEIWRHTAEIGQLLDFAQAYVDKRGLKSSA